MWMWTVQAMGGRFRSTLPSDVRFVVRAASPAVCCRCASGNPNAHALVVMRHSVQGALARESLPASGSAYATDVQRAELRMLFRRYGCHHCGKRFGAVIADHQPPNKTVYGASLSRVCVLCARADTHTRCACAQAAPRRRRLRRRRRWRRRL
jgi:hypothetical protein